MMNKLLNVEDVEYIIPTEDENSVVGEIDESCANISEMSKSERQFLNALILRNRPAKVLELGVAAGASSIVILNAIKGFDSHLYSVDYSENYYKDSNFKSGYFIENYPELMKKHSLYLGGLAGKYLDLIGNDIDFCLIDTVHSNPGEILDFIMVLPYLKEDAVVVFHDTNLQMGNFEWDSDWQFTNNILLSAVYGTKLLQGNYNENDENLASLPNIAAIKLNKQTREHIFEIFNLLSIKWQYNLTEDDKSVLFASLKKFYPEKYSAYFEKVLKHQEKLYLKSIKKDLPKKLSLLEKIFSLRNENGRKILTVLNVKIKLR